MAKKNSGAEFAEDCCTNKSRLFSMTLIVPKLQKSLNLLLRQHWAVFQKEQLVFDMLVHGSYMTALGKVRKEKANFNGRQVRVAYTLYFKDGRKRDLSNYGQKMIDDSLVKEGIIDDDNSRVILEETVKIRYDKKNPRTEIYIEEVKNEESS